MNLDSQISSNPDLLYIGEDNDQAGIEQIRNLKNFLVLKPIGRWKFVVIDNSHKMQEIAQALGARVQGDEGEYYDNPNQDHEKKPWWRFW